METATTQLVHYTSSAETIVSILENGFLLIPNKRYLINALLGEERFAEREPQEFAPPPDTIFIKKSYDGAYRLPEVQHIFGTRLVQDELISNVGIAIQYQTRLGQKCQVAMPFRDALHLLNALRELQWRSGLDPLNPLDENNRPRALTVGRFTLGTNPAQTVGARTPPRSG